MLVVAVGAPLAARPSGARIADDLVAVAFAVGAAVLAAAWAGRRAAAGVLGVIAASAGVVVLTQARHGGTSWILAAIVGAGAALAIPRTRANRAAFAAGLAVALGQVILMARLESSDVARIGALLGAPALVAAIAFRSDATGPSAPGAGRRGRLAPGVALLAASASIAGWVGANSPSARWFGDQVSHGSRSGDEVAITFDDGPDVPYTLQVRDILDRHGVKATFFTVGKALDARPDVSAALLADGDVLGNHSYRHDERGWLDPRYPELGMTQRAFHARLGVCPTFFRAPHGQHTPTMAWQVHRAGMRMVGWDVSAGDFAVHDPAVVARRVLAGVRAGSIIDLHDGLDGDVTADRSVLVQALPAILDGLAARGLHPVTLDRLLDVAPYAGRCR